jgi:hypothetical protein
MQSIDYVAELRAARHAPCRNNQPDFPSGRSGIRFGTILYGPNDPLRSSLLLSHALMGMRSHASHQDRHDNVEEQQR